jgi:hypothetical protein
MNCNYTVDGKLTCREKFTVPEKKFTTRQKLKSSQVKRVSQAVKRGKNTPSPKKSLKGPF